MAAAYALYAI